MPGLGTGTTPTEPGDNSFWHNVMHTAWHLSSPTVASLWP